MKEYLILPRGGIKYAKPKIITCKDCIGYATCPERSRLYPCRSFKPIRHRRTVNVTADSVAAVMKDIARAML